MPDFDQVPLQDAMVTTGAPEAEPTVAEEILGSLEASAAEEALKFLATIRVADNTAVSYARTLKGYCIWAGGLPTSADDAQGYIVYREGQGKAPNTVELDGSALRRYLEWKGAPTRRLERKPVHRPPPKYCSREEIRALLGECYIPLIKTVVEVLYDTAARISEILDLEMEDIDWNGLLTVTRKGGKREQVPISDRGLRCLREWVDEHREGRHAKLFGDWGYKAVYGEMKKAAKRAGLETFTPHYLRHSRAIHLKEQGVDWAHIAYQLGHTKVATTIDTYGRLTGEDLREYIPEPDL